IYADDPERFLLVDIRFIEHPDVDDNLARLTAGLLLKTDPEPAVRFVVLFETARGHCVRKHKKGPKAAELFVKALDQQVVLVIQHCLKTIAAHVTVCRSVNGIAESHVVGGHRLGDGPRRAADMEKSPGDFLPGSDFRESAVLLRVEIYLERLFVRPDVHFRLHPVSRCRTIAGFTTRHLAGGLNERNWPANPIATRGALARRPSPGSSRADHSATPRKSNLRARSKC